MNIHPVIHEALAKTRSEDLVIAVRRAQLSRLARETPSAVAEDIIIREARPTDIAALARLARSGDQPELAGRVVVGTVHGVIRAAVEIDGRGIADPFEPSQEIIELLRLRVGQLRAHGGAVRAGR